jgi:hypothetical protein
VKRPGDLDQLRDLLHFGYCLSQPVRGGKKNNLTSTIIAQIRRIEKCLAAQASGPLGDGSRPHGTFQATNFVEAEAVLRASVKLDLGDVRVAVKQLCSDEVIAPHDAANIASLREKHLLAPSDRRPPPTVPPVPPLIVLAADIRKAIESFDPGTLGQHLRDMTDPWVLS